MPKTADNQIIRKVALAYFEDGKMMQVRDEKSTEVFIAPGGKIEKEESDIDCLKREVKEELSAELDPDSISFLHEFTGPAHGKPGVKLNIRFYTARIIGAPKPAQEVVEIKFFDSKSDPKHLSEIARTQFFPWFKDHGYID